MVNLITGPRGSGKTQQMIELANEKVKTSNGNVVLVAGNHDIETIFIDSVLKQANITLESLPVFLQKLNKISSENNIDFYLSISADKNDIPDIDSIDCNVIS